MMNEGQELAVPAGDEEQRTNYVRIPKGFFIAGLVAMTALVGSAFGLAVSNRAAIQGQTSISSNQQALNPADQTKNFPDMGPRGHPWARAMKSMKPFSKSVFFAVKKLFFSLR